MEEGNNGVVANKRRSLKPLPTIDVVNLQPRVARPKEEEERRCYIGELEINDFPQNVRWKLASKMTLGIISDWTGAAITIRGCFFPQGVAPDPTIRKLYLHIEGPTKKSVARAKKELELVVEDFANPANTSYYEPF